MSTRAAQRHATAGTPGRIQKNADGDQLLLAASGAWTITGLSAIQREMKSVLPARGQTSTAAGRFDVSAVSTLDTAGAWLLQQTVNDLRAQGCNLSFVGLNAKHKMLLDEVARNTGADREEQKPPGWLAEMSSNVLSATTSAGRDMLILVTFFGLVLTTLTRTLAWQSKFRWTAFAHHLEHTGVRAIPIIALICFLIGAVVMQQGALQLATYGAEPYAASMLAVLALREVGVLLTAVMVAGRSASAFTAEIGSMKMREEIAAMRTIGIDPIETLVLPRIMALLVALPLLTFLGDIMCLAGGAAVAVLHLDQSIYTFLERLQSAAEPRHFFAGLIKTPFAALVIGLVGCSEGLKVEGSAESLGRHVTSAVVKSIFLVIILGALFAMFLVTVGI